MMKIVRDIRCLLNLRRLRIRGVCRAYVHYRRRGLSWDQALDEIVNRLDEAETAARWKAEVVSYFF